MGCHKRGKSVNQMPADWTEQLRQAYPHRSGPCGWGGMKLMLAVRRALLETSWERIMEGVRGYAEYARMSGKWGSEFIVAPKTFFDDAIYLEELTYKAPEHPEKIKARQAEEERMARAKSIGSALIPPVIAVPGESAAAYETRVMLAQQRPVANNVRSIVAGLTERMRIAK